MIKPKAVLCVQKCCWVGVVFCALDGGDTVLAEIILRTFLYIRFVEY